MSLCSSLVPKPHPALAHLFETRTCILVQILVELHNEEECCHLMLLCPSLHHKLPALLWLQSDHLRQPCIESNGNKDPLINCMQEANIPIFSICWNIFLWGKVWEAFSYLNILQVSCYILILEVFFSQKKWNIPRGFFIQCNLLLEITILCEQLQKCDLTLI